MSGTEFDPDGTDSFHPDHPWEQTAHPLYLPPIQRTLGNWPPVPANPAGPYEASQWAHLRPSDEAYLAAATMPSRGEADHD